MFYWIFMLLILGASCSDDDLSQMDDAVLTPVDKTNSTKLYMHYMPWFHSKEYSGYWGSHWRMSNKNPENITNDGRREIASHYYPLIGPYDSGDPVLINYHLLLMKYAGIDGILIDWYGSHNILDYGSNLKNSNAIIDGARRIGLQFGIVYEEFTCEEVERRKDLTDIEAAREDMRYMSDQYWNQPNYVRINNRPLLLTFGPRHFLDKGQWTTILSDIPEPIEFYPLWHHKHRVGEQNAAGEFAWVDFNEDLNELKTFYSNDRSNRIASAYPGFHDYYVQGGWGDSYGYVDLAEGENFNNTLELADDKNMSIIQFVTWNDFGEGTMLEPTEEYGFSFIHQIQQFAGVKDYDQTSFDVILDYYQKSKQYSQDASVQDELDDALNALIQLDIVKAESILSQL